MNTQMKIDVAATIIVPSYKPGDYLWKCIDTLLQQTLSKDNFEVIFILNGCNEPYTSTIKAYLDEKDPNGIAHFIQTDVPGVSNARNVGIDAARGEYIAFVDDDDFVSPTYLEELLRVSDRETVGISNEMRYNDSDGSIREESFTREYQKKSRIGKQPYPGTRKAFSGPCMKLLHRDIIASYRFDTGFTNGEDSLFMFQISRNMKYVNYTSPDAVYYRRVRAGSAMSKERKVDVMISNRAKLMGRFIRVYASAPFQYSFKFLLTRLMGCLHSIINSIKSAMRTTRITPPRIESRYLIFFSETTCDWFTIHSSGNSFYYQLEAA